MNKYFIEAQKSKRAPSKLTKKEAKQGKVNPERKRKSGLKKAIRIRKAGK